MKLENWTKEQLAGRIELLQKAADGRRECLELVQLVLASDLPTRVTTAKRLLARGLELREPDDRRHWLE